MSLKWVRKWDRHFPRAIRRVLRPLFHRYFEVRGYPLVGPLAGCRMQAKYIRSYHEGSYEPEVCRTIMRIVQPGWVCVDIGGHVGYFTLLLAKLVGEHGHVIAFEAHAENAEQLRSNVRINGYEARVRVENMAVSDGTCCRVMLFPGRWRSSAEWNIVGHDVEGNLTEPESEVPATSLDAYFCRGLRVDFVKIDIEGAEALALCGMRRLLRESKPLVLVEFHNESGWTGRQELFSAGYYLYDIINARWLDGRLDVQRVYHCLAVAKQRLNHVRL